MLKPIPKKKITEILREKDFFLSAEIFPLKNGEPQENILKIIEELVKLGVDFISVTRGAGGSMRGGTVPICYVISERYHTNVLAHFRCREHTKKDVENLLVDHQYFGISNILALLGDPLPGEPANELDPKIHNRYACELVAQISELNMGHYLPYGDQLVPRKGVKTDFCIGVACYPEAKDMEKEIYVLSEKVKSGASYAITQMFFKAEAYKNYIKNIRAKGIEIPIIPGIRPVINFKQLKASKEMFGANVPIDFMEKVEALPQDEAREECIKFTLKLCSELKECGAPGIHLFILNDIKTAKKIICRLRWEKTIEA